MNHVVSNEFKMPSVYVDVVSPEDSTDFVDNRRPRHLDAIRFENRVDIVGTDLVDVHDVTCALPYASDVGALTFNNVLHPSSQPRRKAQIQNTPF